MAHTQQSYKYNKSMFKPYYGKCEGKPNKQKGCGGTGWITTSSRLLCQNCENERKGENHLHIPKISPKKAAFILESKSYYRQKIAQHIAENKGRCPCEECGTNIINPTGMNVSHILHSSTHKELYLVPENSNILCKVGDNPKNWGASCHNKWETGDKKSMKIYPKNMDVIEKLLAQKKPSK
jgi:hypothetical protein